MVLLVVDTQKLITNESLYNFSNFMSTVRKLIKEARQNSVEILFIRHDDGPGNPLSKGNDGYEIQEAFRPEDGEKIFDKKVNSPFKESGLLEYLEAKKEKELMVTGLQTDYCIDATVKCGFEHGFHMIVPENANTTVDNAYLSGEQSCRYYNTFLWQNRYATCISLEEAIQRIRAQV